MLPGLYSLKHSSALSSPLSFDGEGPLLKKSSPESMGKPKFQRGVGRFPCTFRSQSIYVFGFFVKHRFDLSAAAGRIFLCPFSGATVGRKFSQLCAALYAGSTCYSEDGDGLSDFGSDADEAD